MPRHSVPPCAERPPASVIAGRHLVLVGLMGSGKTTVGRALAVRLGREFHDSDALIEEQEGRTVREIFESEGEDAFRSIETDVLGRSLAHPDPLVIAAAGGVVLRPENRKALRDSGARVVWLRADPSLLVDRVKDGQHRPLLDGDVEGTLRQMHEQRESLYRDVADAVVSADRRSISDLVEAVLR